MNNLTPSQRHTIGKVLWLLSVLSLLIAWFALSGDGIAFGLDTMSWYWNALIFGVLALPLKIGKV